MGMRSISHLKKTIYYLKRNGWKATWYAAKERLQDIRANSYSFVPASAGELAWQRREASHYTTTFSIVVPTYRTDDVHLREMIQSVMEQTYSRWELLLADATEDDSVERVVIQYNDPRIRYIRLEENKSISENTNRALLNAVGDYTGLLDHDDVLTPNALFEMVKRIEEEKKNGVELKMLYSDEDKCNGDRSQYFEPNIKEKFNLDLLLSNNYICHFMVMETAMMQELGFRRAYDGAQDYDLVLRAVGRLMEHEEEIAHIPRVLYHWRCHSASTAENPQSKQYAYEAGRRALQDFADAQGWGAEAAHLKHLGFYTLRYRPSVLENRKDLGAVGGRVVEKDRIIGGRLTDKGEVMYKGLSVFYSGYLHRAVLSQDAEAVDIRRIQVRKECRELFERVVGVPYRTVEGQDIFDSATLPKGINYKLVSRDLGRALRSEGYRILWMPEL